MFIENASLVVQIKNDKHEIDHQLNWSSWKLLFTGEFVHVYATIYTNKFIFLKNLILADIIFEVNIINKITHNTHNNSSNVSIVRSGEGLYMWSAINNNIQM